MSSFPVIIDTDPGTDDALALYLALGSPQLDVRAITLVSGNSTIKNVTRNLVTIFDIIDKEIKYLKNSEPPKQIDPQQWEKEKDILLKRFEWSKPIVAMGSDKPIKASRLLGDFFHGQDGIGELYTTHLHYEIKDWENIKSDRYTKSSRNAIDEILYQLQNAPPFTITIIGLGPLTNIALAYEKDKYVFSRVKQVICLGGAIDSLGNTTPCAEFNFYVDPDAVSILAEATKGFSPSETVQSKIEKLNNNKAVPLHFTILPINVSSRVFLSSTAFKNNISSLNTPLSIFISVFMDFVFKQMVDFCGVNGLEMHDPLAIALSIDILSNKPQAYTSEFADMKIETQGTYTRGMAIIDRRQRPPSKETDELLDGIFTLWSKANANNVEIITSYSFGSFMSTFFKTIFNVDYSEDENK